MVLAFALSFVVMVIVLVTAVVVTKKAIHDVPEDEVHALVVFDKIQGVLLPGRNYIPPLFSETYPIDRERMAVEHDGEKLQLPEDCVERIERYDEQQAKKSGRR
jgi:regulator of protease activity HflC (stomatin/prohibitin superfamily)